MADPIQPWDLPLPPDETRRRLAINLPQLLPPLADSSSPGPMSERVAPKPALADTPTSTPLAVQPPRPKPLAEQYRDVERQISETSQPVTEPHINVGRKILGTLLSLSSNPNMAKAGYDWTHPAEVAQQRKLAPLIEQGKGIETQAGIAEKEATAAEKSRLPKESPDSNKTVETGEGVYQWNPDSNRYDIKVGPPKSTNKPDTATQNKEAFQAIVGKVDAAKLPTGPTQLPQSLNAALKQGKITPEEHQKASGYLAANPTPSNTTIVQAAGAQTKEDIKDANTYYRWTDPKSGKIVTGKGKDRPQGVTADPIGSDKEYAQHRREANAANIVQDSINRVAEDVDKNPEIFDNAGARAVLATATDDRQAQGMGILVMGTGGHISMPSGSSKIIDTMLENNAVPQNLRRALKDYIADYWALKDKAVVQQMEMQGGKIGRGSQAVFESIIAQIPAGGTADSTMARRQISNLQQTQDRLNSQYADDGKAKPYQMKQGGGGDPTGGLGPPQPGEKAVYSDASHTKFLGYSIDGKKFSRQVPKVE